MSLSADFRPVALDPDPYLCTSEGCDALAVVDWTPPGPYGKYPRGGTLCFRHAVLTAVLHDEEARVYAEAAVASSPDSLRRLAEAMAAHRTDAVEGVSVQQEAGGAVSGPIDWITYIQKRLAEDRHVSVVYRPGKDWPEYRLTFAPFSGGALIGFRAGIDKNYVLVAWENHGAYPFRLDTYKSATYVGEKLGANEVDAKVLAHLFNAIRERRSA